ncbi:type IX secretion system anionic LPS delivery protein PorZ [Luteibaculum oceani]|uniref:PorZ N-terminal beta-propeller domain-containing protein n=1 Tax=Luteibaculum oceani TaxID=1294296 RepID=A0A5C6VK21_9FLAO|nr:hypothetical protein [Luteibaculum oceani]TXC85309.1 hypothetical protein FRX97_01405 [Luteibaculum oceani]
MTKYIAGLIFFISGLSIMGQSQLRVGSWKDHFSFYNINSVAIAENKIYGAAQVGIVTYNLSDNSISTIGKVEGLSDSKISTLSYDGASSTLIVGYENGNIDLIRKNEIINVPDIVNKSIIGSKRINKITVVEGSIAYFATDFGILKLDIIRGLSLDSFFFQTDELSLAVNEVQLFKDSLFAATNAGIFKAPLNNPLILADFNKWQKLPDLPIGDANVKSITPFNGVLVAGAELGQVGGFWKMADGKNWETIIDNIFDFVFELDAGDNELLLQWRYEMWHLDGNLNLKRKIFPPSEIPNFFNQAIIKNGTVWAGSTNSGIIKIPESGSTEALVANGPRSNVGFRLKSNQRDQLFVGSGGITPNYSNNFNNGGLYTYTKGVWNNYHYTTEAINDTIFDIIQVVGKDAENFYAASWGDGLLEFKNGVLNQLYFKDNSPLEVRLEFATQVNTGFLEMDIDGNLWVGNSYTNELLKVLKPDGNWLRLNLPGYGNRSTNAVTNFTLTSAGQIWITNAGRGIYAFDAGNLEDEADNRGRLLGTSENNGNLPSNLVYDVAEDWDGDIWVGTAKGPAVFYNPDFIFEEDNPRAQQIFIEQDGNVQIVLETEQINAVEIDGGNRKWFGTQASGVFLFSADVTEQIAHFTTSNSPLISNEIIDLEFLPNSGELFISTSEGIQSLKTDAAQPKFEVDGLTVYPNPVRPDYNGLLTIDGFAQDSKVKITSTDGRLIRNLLSNGARATWDLNNNDGVRVGTGVYLIMGSDIFGEQKELGRVLVVRN